jgi:NAD-dependent deacetylase
LVWIVGVQQSAAQTVAATPVPAENATGISVQTALSWNAAGSARTYSIRLQTTRQGIESAAFFGTGIRPDAGRASYVPPVLNSRTTYYWQVVANPGAADELPSPVWSFSTAGAAPQDEWTTRLQFLLTSGIIAGLFTLAKWLADRSSRATDVLLKLEDEFTRKCEKGRPQIEYTAQYELWKDSLSRRDPKVNPDDIDNLLRFYVVLYGIRQARQVPDASLSTSYRFWLAHYYRNDRSELRGYINSNFPTLRKWLLADTSTWSRFKRRPFSKWWRPFFRPDDFWPADEYSLDPEALQSNHMTDTSSIAVRPRRVLVVTGSGISAESGIPTFRSAGGYWRSLNPEDLATRRAFQRDPNLVWEWYRERRKRIASSAPNAAHDAVTRLGLTVDDFLLVTQNVDDLHARATHDGEHLPADRVVQIHGDIFVSRCERCDFSRRDPAADTEPVPTCPRCGARLRPGVVWFDEELDPDQVQRVERFLGAGPCQLVLVVGTTVSFDYISQWIHRSIDNTGVAIEVNPDETVVSKELDRHVRELATVGVPRIVDEFLGESRKGPVV